MNDNRYRRYAGGPIAEQTASSMLREERIAAERADDSLRFNILAYCRLVDRVDTPTVRLREVPEGLSFRFLRGAGATGREYQSRGNGWYDVAGGGCGGPWAGADDFVDLIPPFERW